MAKKIVRKKTEEKPKGLGNFSGLFLLPVLLSLFGLFFVYEASSILSLDQFGDSFHYLKMQAVWFTAGFVAMLFFSFFNYKKLYILSFPFMLLSIILLVAVLIPGIGSVRGGARGWIDLGAFNLQPTELAKFSVIVYLASWFTQKTPYKGKEEPKRFMSFLFFLGILLFLIILQPDVGTAIVVFSLSVMIYFLAGRDLWKLTLFIPLGLVGFFLLIKAAPYRLNRLLAFMDPMKDPQGISYHINQILISLSSGGIFGKGFGASRQKYLFLPEAHTDSIFAIIGEEFGFIGCTVLIIAFAMLLYLLYRVYVNAKDPFSRLLAGGIFVFFGLQTIVNLGGMVSIMPLTGVPLPFISYGGSHMIISFVLIGIAINIVKNTPVAK